MDATTTSSAVIHIAIELSATSRVIACRMPEIGKIQLHRMEAGDSAALLALISDLRDSAAARSGGKVIVASCFEAGRDGSGCTGC